MIIEIKDLPLGSKIKTIECKIEFDDSGIVTSSSVEHVPPVVETETSSSVVSDNNIEAEREKNIAPEMENLEF